MKLRFKTNINCGNCVKTVSGFINEVSEIEEWTVDTENPEKILTVSGENIEAEAIIDVIQEAGFDIEPIA